MTSYYDLATAAERLGSLRPLLLALRDDRDTIAAAQGHLDRPGDAGSHAGRRPESEPQPEQVAAIIGRMEAAVRQIDAWGITLRDIGAGLVDFPALANGRPIWLCWKLGEDDIAYWHELDAGIAGRKPLIELE